MAYLNKVFLIGNLTRDPEVRVTPKGTSIVAFGIGVNRTYKDESGASHDEVTFVDIEAWGKQADLVGKYLTKGSPCMVEGRLRLDSWEDKTSGQKRSKLKVVLDNVQFLGRRSDGTPAELRDQPQGQGREQVQETGATACFSRSQTPSAHYSSLLQPLPDPERSLLLPHSWTTCYSRV